MIPPRIRILYYLAFGLEHWNVKTDPIYAWTMKALHRRGEDLEDKASIMKQMLAEYLTTLRYVRK